MNTLRNSLKREYSQIPNDLITDLSLSSGALRVILYLFTKPDNWKVYNKDIEKNLNISDKTLARYWKELLSSKWLRREREKDENGKFIGGGYVYEIGNFTVSEKTSVTEKTSDLNNNDIIKQEVTNKKTNKKEEYSKDFLDLWDSYKPKNQKGDKKKAFSVFKRVMKEYSIQELNMAVDKENKKEFGQRHLSTLLNSDIEDFLKQDQKDNNSTNNLIPGTNATIEQLMRRA